MAAVSSSRVVAKQALSMVLVLALIVPTMITEFASAKAVHALAGDFNGDGVTTPGLFVDGLFILSGANHSGDTVRFHYGRPDDVPVVGDWTGDGIDTVGVVRRGRHWHLRFSNTGGVADRSFTYGGWLGRDRPVVGDWIGKGYDLPGIVRGSTWHLRNALAGGDADITFSYGRVSRGDHPVMGDWNGNGIDTAGIVRDGRWHLKNTHTGGSADWTFSYGRADDVPVVGSWDGRKRDTPGVVRGTTWLLKNSLSGGPADIVLEFPDSTGDDVVEALRRPDESPSRATPSKPAPEPEPEPVSSPEPSDVQGDLTRTAIGSPEPTGSLSLSGDVYTLSGGGADIWKASDSFEFAHQVLDGDGKVIVRVNSQTATDKWAKAGLMIRSDLTPGAQHVSVFQTPAHGAVLQYRPRANANAVHVHGIPAGSPTWLELERKGSTFTARSSKDGLKWTLIGSVSVAMATVAFVGLAVTSHNDGTPSSAQFDSLEQRALESTEEPLTAPTQADDVADSVNSGNGGALYWAGDVERWRARVDAGFVTPGGDIARIRSNAAAFAGDPQAGHWSDTGGSGCVAYNHIHGSGNNVLDGAGGLFEESVRMRDAAWWALVTGDDGLARTVADQLVAQARDGSVDFTDTSRWCHSSAHERFFPLAMFLAKHLQALDYVREHLSDDEWKTLRRWHVAAGEFHLAAATWGPYGTDRIWADAPNGDYTPTLSGVSEGSPTYRGGPTTTTLNRRYNNRKGLTAMYAGMVGVLFEDQHLTREAARWGREFVKFSLYPDGTMAELYRGTGGRQLGMAYSFLALGPMLYLADALERGSDEELLFYETRDGVFDSESGPGDPPKSLQRAAAEMGRMMSHEVIRYHEEPYADENLPLDLRSGRDRGWSSDVVLAVGNQHWKDPYITGIYQRTNPGMVQHEARPLRGWSNPWQGAWGLSPGPMLLHE